MMKGRVHVEEDVVLSVTLVRMVWNWNIGLNNMFPQPSPFLNGMTPNSGPHSLLTNPRSPERRSRSCFRVAALLYAFYLITYDSLVSDSDSTTEEEGKVPTGKCGSDI